MVTHESTRTFTPERLRVLVVCILTKRDPPKSRSNRQAPFGARGSADSAAHVSLSSIFSFQRTDIADAVSWAVSLLASGPPECRSRGSLEFFSQLPRRLEANFFVASSVAAVVGEAYIVGGPSECQQRFSSFLNFLRRSPADATSHAGLRACRWKDSSFSRSRCRILPSAPPLDRRFRAATRPLRHAHGEDPAAGPAPPLRVRALSLLGCTRLLRRSGSRRPPGRPPESVRGRGRERSVGFPGSRHLSTRKTPHRFGTVAVRPHCRPNDVRHDGLRVAGRVGSRLLPHPPGGVAEGGFVDLRGNDRQLSRPNANKRCADRGNVAF